MPLLNPLNPPMADWSGKTVWMIGASTGIGRATASALHARGARVVVSARKALALEAFVAEHPGLYFLRVLHEVVERSRMDRLCKQKIK